LVEGVCGFEALVLVVRGAGGEVWDCINFFRKWKKLDGYVSFVKKE